MRLIDADDLIKAFEALDLMSGQYAESFFNQAGNRSIEIERAEDYISNAPTVDAEPVVHAHWVLNPNGMDWGLPAWTCSHCGGRNDMIPPFITTNKGGYVPKNPNAFAGSNYCPNCGAKMDS
jgi:hypothetical protein